MRQKKFMGTVGLAVVVSLMAIVQANQAAQAQSGSAMQDGKANARADFLNSLGRDKNTSCDPNNTAPDPDAYCTAYKLAYEAQWAYMSLQYDCSSGECR